MKVKYIGIILLSSFIGIMCNPEMLAASDSVAVVDLDQTNIVETIVPEAEETPAVSVAQVKTTPTAPKAGVAAINVATVQKTAEVPKTATNQIKFAWGTQNLVLTSSTSIDAGANVMKSERLLWAHNNTAFNNIKGLKIGDIFSVTIDRVTKNYKVVANPIDGKAGISLEKTGEQTFSNGVTMSGLKYYGFGGHDLVLMTCDKTGNTHRYVVVADAI